LAYELPLRTDGPYIEADIPSIDNLSVFTDPAAETKQALK
jgi:hypothetical protein